MLEGAVMPTYVALLRAVNVPNSTKLSMAEFRKLLEGLGYKRVETYIQSGNAVFDAPVPAAKTAKAIAAALEKLMGGPVGVLLRTHEELGRVIAGNPYASEAAADGARVHAVFLSGIPVEAAIAGLKKIPPRSDRYHHLGDTLSSFTRRRCGIKVHRQNARPHSGSERDRTQLEYGCEAARDVASIERYLLYSSRSLVCRLTIGTATPWM
jgi:uncharacterized protein (DUF1697 family)